MNVYSIINTKGYDRQTFVCSQSSLDFNLGKNGYYKLNETKEVRYITY